MDRREQIACRYPVHLRVASIWLGFRHLFVKASRAADHAGMRHPRCRRDVTDLAFLAARKIGKRLPLAMGSFFNRNLRAFRHPRKCHPLAGFLMQRSE